MTATQEEISLLKTKNPDKLQYSLLPESSLRDIVRAFMYGARKYSPNNWMLCKDSSMYYDAAMRHLGEWRDGQYNDKESNLPSLSHAICSLIILHYLEQEKKNVTKTNKTKTIDIQPGSVIYNEVSGRFPFSVSGVTK